MSTNANQYLEVVNGIPVDQEAPAHYPVKKFLLEKMRTIFNNKQVIRNAAVHEQRKKILDAYKKHVGFSQKVKVIASMREKLDKAEKVLIQVGLSEYGTLLELNESWNGSEKTYQIRWNQSWMPIEDSVADEINRVRDLMKAVEGETDPFTVFDQLETRMMMSSTVGELMAVINAAAEEPVFKLNPNLLTNGNNQ